MFFIKKTTFVILSSLVSIVLHILQWGRHDRDHMLVGFTITCVISATKVVSSNPNWLQGVFNTTLCDTVCQWLATGWWLSRGTPVSSINKIDHHDMTEILLKVTLSTINQTNHILLPFIIQWNLYNPTS
jgi:hypothetical protein